MLPVLVMMKNNVFDLVRLVYHVPPQDVQPPRLQLGPQIWHAIAHSDAISLTPALLHSDNAHELYKKTASDSLRGNDK